MSVLPSPGRFRLSAPLEAVLWAVLSSAIFSVGNVLIRHVSSEVHPFEVVFFRNLFSLLFLLPWVAASGFRALRTARLRIYGTRSLTSLAAMLSWFYGLSVMPLPDATALAFTAPLFTTVGAALFLGESVRVRRWAAVAAGFAGVLIILRPGAGTLTLGAGIVLVSCAFSAATTLQVRSLARSEGAVTMVTYMVLFITPLSLVTALPVWEWPSWTMLGWLALLGAVLTLGHLALTRAFQLAEASALMPYDYVKLPFTALIAYLLYGEVMDGWSWFGAAVITGSALYIAHRESVLARRARAIAPR